MSIFDLVVIGGGINGVGIVRDAAGRGLSVLLCEQGDLAAATSSASSKLIHGGLRYLENFEFRLVAEALAERKVLLSAAPHLIHPLRFVLPHVPGLRPAWMIRVGLFLYDRMGGRSKLPATQFVELRQIPLGSGLKPDITKGFVYSDCVADDARLVIVNACSAAELGATIRIRTRCIGARRESDAWRITLRSELTGREETVQARALVNAAGPWVGKVFAETLARPSPYRLRLVKGSHIVVPKLYPGDYAFILQNRDRRVVFLIPFEGEYTLIGTTEVDAGEPASEAITGEEIDYLCRAVNRYLEKPVTPTQVIWSYSGVRPLFDDGKTNVSKVTRDYTLHVDAENGMLPLLTVFGGKLTAYRALSEQAVEKLRRWFPHMKASWTAHAQLPGGDIPHGDLDAYVSELAGHYPGFPAELLRALAQRHGTGVVALLGEATRPDDLGRHFGAGLYEREISHFVEHEWALTAQDVLWRRTKAGLHMSELERAEVARYVHEIASVGRVLRTNRFLNGA